MARFVMVSLVLASAALLLLSSAAAQIPEYDYQAGDSISPANSEDGEAYAPVTIEYGFPPENSEQFEDNFNQKCVEEIYVGMFKTGPLTKNCPCKYLVHLGYGCHIRLAKYANPKYRAQPSVSSVALATKSVQIWQKCVSVVQTGRFRAAPAPLQSQLV